MHNYSNYIPRANFPNCTVEPHRSRKLSTRAQTTHSSHTQYILSIIDAPVSTVSRCDRMHNEPGAFHVRAKGLAALLVSEIVR